MITRLSHTTLFVKSQDDALKFYTEKLGFEKRMDVRFGGFRWLTVAPPLQKEVEMVLLELEGVFESPFIEKFQELRQAGTLGGIVFCSDDCEKDYVDLKGRGVVFKSPPEKKPFGVQATFCDDSNNWFSLTQPR